MVQLRLGRGGYTIAPTTVESSLTLSLVAQEAGEDVFVASLSSANSLALAAQETGSDTFLGTLSLGASLSMAAQESGQDAFAASLSVSSQGSITFGAATYTRGADGTSPVLDIADVASTGISGGTYTLYCATRDAADPELSISDIKNGTGDAIEVFSIGPQANIADLDSAGIDLSNSLSSDAIDFVYEHSGGTQSSVGAVTGVTYDATPPEFVSAEIGGVDATSLIVALDKAVFGSTLVADWDVQVNGSPATESGVSFAAGGSTLDITLGAAVTSGQTVTVAYNGTGLVGIDNEQMATFTAQTVTNNVASGFTENAVTASGAEYLTGSVLTDPAEFLIFASLDPTATDARTAIAHWGNNGSSGGVWLDYTNNDGFLNPRFQVAANTSGNTYGAEGSNNFALGDRLHVLVSGTVNNGSGFGAVRMYVSSNGGAWVEAGSVDLAETGASFDMSANPLRFFARNNGSQGFVGDSYRAAMWTWNSTGNIPDISSPAAQSNFANGASIADPALARAAYGSTLSGGFGLIADFNGDAADYNAGTHDGGDTFTATGTFT